MAPPAVTVRVPVPTCDGPRTIALASVIDTLFAPLLLSDTAPVKSLFAEVSAIEPPFSVVVPPAMITESGPSVIDAAVIVRFPSVRIAVPNPGPLLLSARVPPAVIEMSPPAILDGGEPIRDPELATVPGFSVTLFPTVIEIVVG